MLTAFEEIVGLGCEDEVGGYEFCALMQELEEGVLGVGAGFAEEDGIWKRRGRWTHMIVVLMGSLMLLRGRGVGRRDECMVLMMFLVVVVEVVLRLREGFEVCMVCLARFLVP